MWALVPSSLYLAMVWQQSKLPFMPAEETSLHLGDTVLKKQSDDEDEHIMLTE